MSINKYICTGRLTKDPELRAISEDMRVCQLRLAVDGMGRAREVGYINVSVFGASAEAAAKYLAKGWLVAVDGRLEYGEWESEGAKRHDYSVVGNVEFLAAPRPVEEPPEAKPARKKAGAGRGVARKLARSLWVAGQSPSGKKYRTQLFCRGFRALVKQGHRTVETLGRMDSMNTAVATRAKHQPADDAGLRDAQRARLSQLRDELVAEGADGTKSLLELQARADAWPE